MSKKTPDKNNTEETAVVRAAFGAKNRERLIQHYFNRHPFGESGRTWQHVYRLLLWTDQTTGLVHCYESDKSQPGKNWYGRTLAFHEWTARMLGVEPGNLAGEIDWLFRHATSDLATEVLHRSKALAVAAERQRKPYANLNLPGPGEDPELVALIKEILGDHLTSEVPASKWQTLVQRVRQHLALENKRKNLVGEGFEDVIVAILRRAPQTASLNTRTRLLLHDIPGFNRARRGDKPNKVDVAIILPSGTRILVSAKWSVRADREKQFSSDYADYVMSESDRKPFQYVFVTNEFDPARLARACESLHSNASMFSNVVHINAEAISAVYGANPSETSMKRVLSFIEERRLIGFDQWIQRLGEPEI